MATMTRPLGGDEARAAMETGRAIAEVLQDVAGQVDQFVLRSELESSRELTLRVPEGALQLLGEILEQMGQGNSVTVVPFHAELTTQEAARLLNVSRPFVVKMIDEGQLPHRKVGTHRRVRVEDVMDYKRRDDVERRAVADELALDAVELGLGYE